jgi:flagellar hook protein FlgE
MAVGLSGILNNGVAGMLAFSEGMGAISDNIANQNTVGYKRVETLFSTLVGRSENASTGSSSTSPTLRANNTQGVKPITRQLVDIQGAVQVTNREFDLAISGKGMFIFGIADADTGLVDDFVYSRAGDMSPFVVDDTDAFLANKNGHFLMAQEITAADLLTPAAPTSLEELVPVQVSSQDDFAGLATTTAELAAVIPASGATSVGTPIFYIDANGDQQSITLTFSNPVVTTGTGTTWDVSITDSLGVVQPAFSTLTFDTDGQLPAGSTVTITDNGNTFVVDVEAVAMLGDAASTSTQAVQIGYTHDGLPAGAFEGLEFRQDGVVFGRYTGGATQPLYRIPVATFANPNALRQLAGNEYQVTEDDTGTGIVTSGLPEFILLGGDEAKLVLTAVETSNVDLADSFSQMIVVQRAYSSAATVVRTADEMSTTVRDLMR